MAKKIYHIPLQEALRATDTFKSETNKLLSNPTFFEYHKLRGKSYYFLEVEAFVVFFKIDKDLTYTLKTIEYFNSKTYIETFCEHLNFSQYKVSENKEIKEFFYAYCSVFSLHDERLFKKLLFQFFMHYHASVNNKSNIEINYKDIVTTLAKTKKLEIKESFKETNGKAHFKILIDGVPKVILDGKSIKSLRKKAYRRVLFEILIE